jgi:hypothetical protein
VPRLAAATLTAPRVFQTRKGRCNTFNPRIDPKIGFDFRVDALGVYVVVSDCGLTG